MKGLKLLEVMGQVFPCHLISSVLAPGNTVVAIWKALMLWPKACLEPVKSANPQTTWLFTHKSTPQGSKIRI